MSDKKETKTINDMKISNYVVGVGGNLRKTTVAIMKTELLRYNFDGTPNGNQVAVFVTDNHHQELAKVHGTKIKGVQVEPKHDKPLSGVGFFNLREDSEAIINNLQTYDCNDLIQDNPADSVDYQNALGDISEFIGIHKDMNKKLLYTLPLVDAKSLSSIDAIYELFAGHDISNVLFEFVIFEGSMKHEKAYDEFLSAYSSNPHVQALKKSGQVKEISIDKVIKKEIGQAYVKSMRYNDIVKESKSKALNFYDFLQIKGMYTEYSNQFLAWLPIVRTPQTNPVILEIV